MFVSFNECMNVAYTSMKTWQPKGLAKLHI